jgi:hypothetical protein
MNKNRNEHQQRSSITPFQKAEKSVQNPQKPAVRKNLFFTHFMLLMACYGKSIFKKVYAASHVATPTTSHNTKRHRADNKAFI